MAGPIITSKSSLKRYMLSRLGAPVVNIEITDEQLDNAITDALDEFIPRAYSGIVEGVYPVKLLPGVHEYQMPYDVWAITGVNTTGVGGLGSMGSAITNPFHINNYIAADLYSSGSGKIDLLSYEMTFEALATLDLLIGTKLTYDYNCFTKTLNVFDQFNTGTINTVGTGTVSTIGNSNLLRGVGTIFTAELNKGDMINAGGIVRRVSSIVDASNLLMDSATYVPSTTFLYTHAVTETNVMIQAYRKITPREELVDNPAFNSSIPEDPVTNPRQVLQEMTNIYDQKWIKRMSTEKARYQWAVNLSKFSGSVLPNGGSLNASGILDMAEKNIDILMKELYEEMMLPADFFVGSSKIMLLVIIFLTMLFIFACGLLI
jgi:hypothetical protein